MLLHVQRWHLIWLLYEYFLSCYLTPNNPVINFSLKLLHRNLLNVIKLLRRKIPWNQPLIIGKKRSIVVVLLKWMTGLFNLTYGQEAVMTVCFTSVTSLQTSTKKRELALMERTDSVVAAGWSLHPVLVWRQQGVTKSLHWHVGDPPLHTHRHAPPY